ncbi:MAG TPA: aminoglycoside phosphotransferase family protein [Ilumatobacteraceae bacterium]|nr:aminoglycoside phosphotransferase family protein [Ilumatobacteraceae bacterium]
MAAQNMPAAEVDVTEGLVRRLLAEQHPDLAERPLVLVANGWDNVIFRLDGGDDAALVVRVPRRQLGADLVANEHRWLPELALRLPIPIPAPVRFGEPSDEYPWKWSVCQWFDGDVAADVAPDDLGQAARSLGAFLAALHVPAPSDAPHNVYRCGPATEPRPRFEGAVERLGALVDGSRVRARWEELVSVDEWDGDSVWLHGDLHTANVIVHAGAVSAVIDLGDITAGDPAVDFAIGWMLFDDDDRLLFRTAAGGVDDATWSRAEAWALHFALMYLLHSADSERFERMGTSLLARILGGC